MNHKPPEGATEAPVTRGLEDLRGVPRRGTTKNNQDVAHQWSAGTGFFAGHRPTVAALLLALEL